MRRLLWTASLLLTLASPSAAGIIESQGCTRQAVQQAVDQASPGDTVQLPACRQAWSGPVTITKPLTLRGAGAGQTVLERQTYAVDFASNPMLHVRSVTGVVITGLTLDGTYDTHPSQYRDTGIWLEDAVDFRVHHMAFSNLALGLFVNGNPTHIRGLIDHNTFTDMYYQIPGVRSLGYGVWVNGDGSWPALALGTAQNVFLEDNTFVRNRHSIASNNGARYVARHNTIRDNRQEGAGIDAHGQKSWPRGARQYEIYHNTIVTSGASYAGIAPRGGSGVIFANRLSPQTHDRDVLLLQEEGCGRQQDQISNLYLWGNTRTSGGAAQVQNQCPGSLREGQDYHLTAPAGYTPYRYPHPLATGGSVAVTSPAPSNLRILMAP